jgi:hypothetical protein
LVLVLDAREQLCPQLSNCFWFIERERLIHLAALKVTRLAAGLKYRPDVRSESRPSCHCLERGERRQKNERTDEKETRNKAMPKHQLNIAPITKTRNADSTTQHFIRVQVDDESPRVVPKRSQLFIGTPD